MVDKKKLQTSIAALAHALKYEKRIKEDQFYMSGISKCYEVCLEYAWKYLRGLVIDKGLEAFGPKDSIKLAGQIGLIDNVEEWLKFINDRNLAVHDYAKISDADYLESAKSFLKTVQGL